MKRLADGFYAFENDLVFTGEGTMPFVTGAGWLAEIIEVDSGEYFFYRDGEKVASRAGHFGVFYPPFSLTKLHVNDVRGRCAGIGGFAKIPDGFPCEPVLFETDFAGPFDSAALALDVINSAAHRRPIMINTRSSLLSVKAKRLIDENYQVYPSIARIAVRLKVTPEHLSRTFKRDHEINPSAYLHQVRVAEATFKLSIGEEIIDISHDVGYNDLSRFYKQFRKTTKTSPGDCRTTLRVTR